jgi:sulfhydrogenase subunit beta (sulfur reductase)
MMHSNGPVSMRAQPAHITLDGLGALIEALKRQGHRVIGPRLENGSIRLDDVGDVSDLPLRVRDVQEPGRYRVERDGDAPLLAHGAPADGWKRFLYPPVERLWRARRTNAEDGDFTVDDAGLDADEPPLALFAVRPCDLVAIAILDAVLAGAKGTADPRYRARREQTFVVAVECIRPAETCFCASMGTGPRAATGFDLVLNPLPRAEEGDPARLLIAAGSDRGARLLQDIDHRPASASERAAAEAATAAAAAAMTRTMPADVADILRRNLESPLWGAVARRCLGCANCTMVCPTCFCASIEDTTDLGGAVAERRRVWDSCFTLEHSYVHGGSIRTSAAARYRQWMAHKLSFWHGQFGTSGCVGCGRCITWCPVGIDITEEAARLRVAEGAC